MKSLTLELTVAEIGQKGDGVAHSDEGPVFIPRSAPGDRVTVKAAKDHAGTLRGEITAIVAPGPERAEPPCPHYDLCGGCALQHVTADFYKTWKTECVRETLARKGVNPESWQPSIFIPPATRRRATIHAYKKGAQLLIGYYRRRSHIIANIDECRVLDPALPALQQKMKPHLGALLQDGKPADLFLQKAGSAIDLVITAPLADMAKNAPGLAAREALAALAEDCDIARISWRQDPRQKAELILQRKPVIAQMGPLAVELPPGAFLQPSAAGEKALVDDVLAAMPAHGHFADLFAGCGTFSGPLLARGRVDAFESDEAAAGALGKAGGGKPLQAVRRDLFRDPLTAKELSSYDALVLDPPRAGAVAQAKALAASSVPVIAYISCNPASFARDAAILIEGGYHLKSARPFDQFIWSPHTELSGIFIRA